MKRVLLSFGAALITLVSAGRASAASITFVLDCEIQNTTPATCTPGGSFGKITLTDPTGPGANTNRVDIDVVLYAMAGVNGIHNVYLNYDNSLAFGGATNRAFGVVDQAAPAGGVHNFLGDVDASLNNQGPFHTRLDINIDPSENPGLTWSGSLVLFDSKDSAHLESNLNVSMFALKDADNLLYAAINTLPDNRSQEFGALSTEVNASAVPEPASLVLLGSGLLGIAKARRRRSK